MQNSSFQIIDHPAPLSVCIFNRQPPNKENSGQNIYHIISIYRDSTVSRKLPLIVRLSRFPKGPKRGLTCSVEMNSIHGVAETNIVSKGKIHYIFIGLEKGTYLSSVKVVANLECSPNNFRATHLNLYNGTRLTAFKLKQCFNFIVDELEAGRLVADSRYNIIVRGKDNPDTRDMSTSFMTEPINNTLPYTLETMCLKSVVNKSIISEAFEGEMQGGNSSLLDLSHSIINGTESIVPDKNLMSFSLTSFHTARSIYFTQENEDNQLPALESVIQCLCSLSPLVDYFESKEYVNLNPGKLAKVFNSIVQEVREDIWALCKINRFIPEIKQNMDLDTISSKDLFGLLTKFLKKISSDCNKVQSISKEEKGLLYSLKPAMSTAEQIDEYYAQLRQIEDSIVTSLFNGEMIAQCTCTICGESRKELSTYQSLSLQFRDVIGSHQSIDIRKMLERLTKPEKFPKKFYCQNCQQERSCLLKKSILRLPRILILHLDRFQGAEKIMTQVQFPVKNLNLSSFVEPSDSETSKNMTYSLSAVIYQSGDISKGNYAAECKDIDDEQWYRLQGPQVVKIEQKESIRSDSAYVLFYVQN